jgi:hypothetical protein
MATHTWQVPRTGGERVVALGDLAVALSARYGAGILVGDLP